MWPGSVQQVKSYGTFWRGRTDGQTHIQKRITSLPLQNIFLQICEGAGGKHYEPYKISTSSLCEG